MRAADIHGVTFHPAYLEDALRLAGHLLERFFDAKHGGFYPYASAGAQLLTRKRAVYDGAMPSGNAVAALAPFTVSYPIPKDGARYYLCRNGSCR